MVWEALVLWQKLVLYGLILGALFVYVRMSQVKVGSRPLIPLQYRIALAVLFPVILGLIVVFSSFVLALVAVGLLLLFAVGKITKKKFKIKIVTKPRSFHIKR